MMDFFFNNSFFTKSLSMQWVYRKQTRWLIITEIKHKAMNKQEVKEFNTAEIAKKWTDLQTSVQCPCWSANKNNTSLNRWAINDMYIICFHISITHKQSSINGSILWIWCWLMKLFMFKVSHCCIKHIEPFYLVNDTKTKPRQNVL